jgi:hypothetical protein
MNLLAQDMKTLLVVEVEISSQGLGSDVQFFPVGDVIWAQEVLLLSQGWPILQTILRLNQLPAKFESLYLTYPSHLNLHQ